MRKVTEDFLNREKAEILDASTWLPEIERAEFFNELANWAYSEYEKTIVRDDLEMQDYDESC